MKKKSLAVVLALVMAFVLGTSAMAASSIQASGIVTDADAWDADDKGWNLLITDLHEEDEWLADDIADADTMKEVLGDDYNEDLEVVDLVDISVVGDVSKVVWPLTMELEIEGVTEDSEFYMVHYVDDAWELVAIELGDGYITAEVDSLSPFAFISGDDAPDSPVTGQPISPVAILVFAAAAVLVIVGRKTFAR